MSERKPLTQCFLFLLQDNKIGPSWPIQERNRGYVLLPSKISKTDSIVKLFLKNNVQPLGDELCLAMLAALEQDRVEVIELILYPSTGCISDESRSRSIASICSLISVDSTNEKVVRALFGRDILICSGMTQSKIDSGKMTHAVDYTNKKIVEEILSINVNLKWRDPKVGSFLYLAVRRNDLYLVKLLSAHNVNVNASHNETNPLHLATLNNNLPIISLLLKEGAHIDARQTNGATPLCLAVEKGYFDIYKFLLQNGASIHIPRMDGTTLLHAAAKSGHLKIFKDLVNKKLNIDSRVNYGYSKGCTPLFLAVEKGHIQVAKLLLELGADVNAENHAGQSVLSAACLRKLNEIVETILSYSPNLNCKSNEKVLGKLIIEEGKHIMLGRCDTVRLLLRHGFSISAEDATCTKLMIEAVRLNYMDIVKKLLEHGAAINTIFSNREKYNQYKTTPLITAIEHSEERMIQLLIDHGADVNLGYKEGPYSYSVTPLETAIKASNINAVKILLSASVTITSASIKCAASSHPDCPEIVAILLQNVSKVDSSYLAEAFHHAALNHNQKTIVVLLKHGADINTFFTYWYRFSKITALHLAAVKGWCDMIKLLIINNASIDIKTENNCTPLHFAAQYEQIDAVKILLKFGARIDAVSTEDIQKCIGMSALHYAVLEGQEKMFKELLISSANDPDILVKTNIKKIFNFQHIVSQGGYLFKRFRSPNSFKHCFHALWRHTIKLFTAGFEIKDEDIHPYWRISDTYKDQYQSECEIELARMKTMPIADTHITFYDILRQDVKHFIGYARNDAVQQLIRSKEYFVQFPVYASLIHSKIQKGNERKDFISDGVKIFLCLFEQFSSLPIELKEKIVNHLTNQELAILKYAFTGCLPH